MEAGALLGMHVVIATPAGYQPHADITAVAQSAGAANGGTITISTDPAAAVADADVVYTDVWVSMGEEDEQARRLQDLAPYQVNAQLLAHARAARSIHALPAGPPRPGGYG